MHWIGRQVLLATLLAQQGPVSGDPANGGPGVAGALFEAPTPSSGPEGEAEELAPPSLCAELRSPFADPDRRAFGPLEARLRSPFGAPRRSFVRGHLHAGSDLAGSAEEAVLALCEGVVIEVQLAFPHRTVVVQHQRPGGGIFFSSYKHLEDIRVSIGDTVDADTKLARLFTPEENQRAGFPFVHLHLEIRRSFLDAGEASWTSRSLPELMRYAVDPIPFFAAHLEGEGRQRHGPALIGRATWDPAPPPAATMTRYPGRLGPNLRWIVIHHTSFAEPPGPAGIRDYHREVYGWSDIGYHFVIDALGGVYAGRDLHLLGAHAGTTLEADRAVVAIRRGWRKGNPADARRLDPDWGAIGVVVDGDFAVALPSEAQLAALVWLVERLEKQFGIPPERLIGHREVAERIVEAQGLTLGGPGTTCPGDALQAWLEAYRAPEPLPEAPAG